MVSHPPERTSREPEDVTARLASLALNDGDEPSGARSDQPAGPMMDNAELERFRNAWKQEVSAKKGKEREPRSPSPAVLRPPAKAKEEPKPVKPAPTSEASRSPRSPRATLVSPRSPRKALPVPDDEEAAWGMGHRLSERPKRKPVDAVKVYEQAVENEQAGQLNEALILYRQAFKLDDNVDRAYARYRAKHVLEEEAVPNSTDVVSPTPPEIEPYSFQRHIQTAPDYERVPPHPTTSPSSTTAGPGGARPTRFSPLTAIMARADPPAAERAFEPEDETMPIPIASLPSELLEHVFEHLDVAGLERLASTCWRARWAVAHSERWRGIAEGIYLPPAGVSEGTDLMGLAKRYGGEWRTMLVEEERLRLDGCYIAVCHYVRPGSGDEWVAITHMITYHRFLRFYPDGLVLSYLTTDHPSEVVPRLKPSLRSKGLHIGTYSILRSDDASAQGSTGKKQAKVIIKDLVDPAIFDPKYEFEMELTLRETARGRWNKLDIDDYRSINLETDESLSLALKHQKPFYFSKVRSYQPTL